jgi:penicillin-binding protein 2
MGVGKLNDIDGLSCAKGFLPDALHMKPYDKANTAIGQGSVLVTPIEINTMMMCAVTGNFTPPRLVEKTASANGEELLFGTQKQKLLSAETVAALRSMLCACVNSGTGYRVKNSTVSCGGKTATAQSGQIRDGKEVVHLWFSGFFPAETPQYVVTVLCDGNGKDNSHPSDIFRMIAEQLSK